MFEHKTEEEARKEILNMVEAYCDKYHGKKNAFAAWKTIKRRADLWQSIRLRQFISVRMK